MGDRVLGVGIEPETGRDFLLGHVVSSLGSALRRVRPTLQGAGCSAAIARASLMAKWRKNAPLVSPAEALAVGSSVLMLSTYQPVGTIVKRRRAPFATVRPRLRQSDE